MGLELKILPVASTKDSDQDYSRDVLSFHADYSLLEQLQNKLALVGKPVVEGFTSYVGTSDTHDDYCYSVTHEDSYGNVLKSMTAGQLKEVLIGYNTGITSHYRNIAICNYVAALPEDLKIYLYWH